MCLSGELAKKITFVPACGSSAGRAKREWKIESLQLSGLPVWQDVYTHTRTSCSIRSQEPGTLLLSKEQYDADEGAQMNVLMGWEGRRWQSIYTCTRIRVYSG